MFRLNLGSGNLRYDGFTNVDLYDKTADVTADICDLPFNDNSAAKVMCIQVIEHVPYNKSKAIFKEMYRVLAPGGYADVETPDIGVVCQKILEEGLTDKWLYNLVGEYYRPWDENRYDDWEMNAASIHRNPWTFERICRYAEDVGFKVEKMDWHDAIYKVEENLFVRLHKSEVSNA